MNALTAGHRPGPPLRRQRGISLIEVSIALTIIALSTVGIVAALAQQAEQRRLAETRSTLNLARDALLSFVTVNGRLPCPATSASGGQEAIASNAGGRITCTLQAGFLPAVTLGMTELDAGGWLTNAWRDGANPGGTLPRVIRYGVSSLAGNWVDALTSPSLGPFAANTPMRANQLHNAAIATGEAMFVCASATGIQGAGANRCGTTANQLSGSAAAVVWTLGANGHDTGLYSADEQQNASVGVPRVLISRPYAPAGATGGMFDDQVVWLPYATVAERLFVTGFVQ